MLSRYVVSQVKHNSFFLAGLALGLWAALALVPLDEAPPCVAGEAVEAVEAAEDEFSPAREARPLGAGPAPARSVQRPRYYSTELGMKGRVLAGVLSSPAALAAGGRGRALNATAGRLLPALRFFMAARAPGERPAPGNVVGFTDTREMLKPFHALKYLADNYLDEYDFFFLASDESFVNARRLAELVAGLSGGQDLYMGALADDDSHYCDLAGGILLSHSVLRAVHGELDWCVRNSYSPRHHENIGRCVLHAAGARCRAASQGQAYGAAGPGPSPPAALIDAVTAGPLPAAADYYRLHALVSRLYLERDRRAARRLRTYVWRNTARHPPHYRNGTWPQGLRTDVGLGPHPPDNRFDHLRWSSFNSTHAFLADDRHAVTRLTGAMDQAVQLVWEEVRAWALRRWSGEGEEVSSVQLVEGAWRWEPWRALRYILLLRLDTSPGQGQGRSRLRLVEALRPLGAARLVPAPYVTESGRVWLVLPVAAAAAEEALGWLRRYERGSTAPADNTALVVVLVHSVDESESARSSLSLVRAAVSDLSVRRSPAVVELAETTVGPTGVGVGVGRAAGEGRAAVEAALPRLPRDGLVLLAATHMDYSDDFLNRVRMNTISGVQWFWPLPFARFSQYTHPRFVDGDGHRPGVNTGRFNERATPLILGFSRRDLDKALSAAGPSGARLSVAELLSRAPLRCLRAPEPALVLAPRGPPCRGEHDEHGEHGEQGKLDEHACLSQHRDAGFSSLELGAPHALARLLLETQAAAAA